MDVLTSCHLDEQFFGLFEVLILMMSTSFHLYGQYDFELLTSCHLDEQFFGLFEVLVLMMSTSFHLYGLYNFDLFERSLILMVWVKD